MTVIVFGPQGSQKGLHAEQLRAHFRLTAVLRDFEPPLQQGIWRAMKDPDAWRRIQALNALVLTDTNPPRGITQAQRARVKSIKNAMKEAGLKPIGQ